MRVSSGQYFILAGVLVIVLLSTVVLFTIFSSTRRGMQEYPQEEAELAITNIDRELTRFSQALLANATQDYFEGRARMDDVRRAVVDRIKAYIAMFKEINLPVESNLVIEVPAPIRIGGVVIPPSTLDEAVSKKSIIKIHGYSDSAIAVLAFYYSLTIDQPLVVVKNMLKQVYLKANVLSAGTDPTTGNFTIRFHAETESGNGTSLGDSTLWVLVNESGRLVWRQYIVTPETINLANGTYEVEINASVVYDFYILRIVDSRGITLEMTQIPYVRIQLRSRAYNAINSYHSAYGGTSMEAYTIEMLANGTLIWNYKALPVQGDPVILPLPPISVGNIRVNITDPDTGETWVAPLQIERWIDPGTPYERPVDDPSDFIKTSGRLDENDKLVFLVNFTDPYTGLSDPYRNITVWWIRDPDLLATPPIVTVDWDLSGLVSFSNGVYNLSVIVSETLIASYAVDYSMSIYYKDYHAEIALYGLCWSWLWMPSTDLEVVFPAGTKIITGTQETVLTSPTTIRIPAYSYIFQKEEFPNGTRLTVTSEGVPVARIYLDSGDAIAYIDGSQTIIPRYSSIVLPANDTVYVSGVSRVARWLPRYLPGGEPPNTLGWRLYNGSVRAVLYRQSNIIYNAVADYNRADVVHHNMSIIVCPGNFVIYRSSMRFADNITIHKYFPILIMISGTSYDEGQPYRLNYWAYYSKVTGSIESGSYDWLWELDENIQDVDRFAAQYRSSWGYEPLLFGILFNGTELLSGLSNISVEGSNIVVDTMRIWRTGDYNRRVIEFDKIWGVTALDDYVTILAGSTADYNLVFWVGPDVNSVNAYVDMFIYPPEVVSYEATGS